MNIFSEYMILFVNFSICGLPNNISPTIVNECLCTKFIVQGGRRRIQNNSIRAQTCYYNQQQCCSYGKLLYGEESAHQLFPLKLTADFEFRHSFDNWVQGASPFFFPLFLFSFLFFTFFPLTYFPFLSFVSLLLIYSLNKEHERNAQGKLWSSACLVCGTI